MPRTKQTARKSTAGPAARKKPVDPPVQLPYKATTDPAKVNKPVANLIHPSMKNRWRVYDRASMSIVFDAVSPVRVFKKGTVYDEDDPDPFPVYDRRNDGDLTETDETATLSQYKPTEYP